MAQPGTQYVWLHAYDAHGRPFDLRALRGQVVALTFGSRATQEEVKDVNDTLVEHAGDGRALVVSVVDFEGIPSFAHDMARQRMAESDLPGKLLHVADEEKRLTRGFGVEPQDRVDILVVDADGALRGRFTGAEVDDAVALMEELKGRRRAQR